MQVDVSTLGTGLIWQNSSDDLGAKWLLELLCVVNFLKFAHRFHFEHSLSETKAHAQLLESIPTIVPVHILWEPFCK